MKKLAFLFCIILTFGCSSIKHDTSLSNMPLLLESNELPAIPQRIINYDFYLNFKMLVNEKGEVVKAILVDGLGIPEWDSSALDSVKKWKYDPARVDGTPVKLWLIQKVKVQIENPYYLTLSEIMCDSYDEALIVISKLSEGGDFGELAVKYSKDSSRDRYGFIGKKDINLYPPHISRELKKLSANQYSQPLLLGKKFVVFKRLKV